MAKNPETVCIVGLGYVGLPLAVGFAKTGLNVIGFDVKEKRISDLKQGTDITGETSSEELKVVTIDYATDPSKIKKADYVIIAVPTPVDENNHPDLTPVESAAETVGKNLKNGAIVILESTVYPGVTEEVMAPIIEKKSGFKCGKDFKVGYSPERINPGDKEHTVDKIVKVVSGMDNETLDKVASLYSKVTKAGIFRAKNIKTAEAAKVIENIQRDLNIALMNELSIIFSKMGIETLDVLEASATKWNFQKYVPGLVGGHCIPVDPYYLTHKAQQLGYDPKVILAGREINNSMAQYICDKTISMLESSGKEPKKSKVLVMGLTFKENVKDIRTSRSKDIIDCMKKKGVSVSGYEPILDNGFCETYFKIPIQKKLDTTGFDAIVIVSPHKQIREEDLTLLLKKMNSNPIVVDIKGVFRKNVPNNVPYFCL